MPRGAEEARTLLPILKTCAAGLLRVAVRVADALRDDDLEPLGVTNLEPESRRFASGGEMELASNESSVSVSSWLAMAAAAGALPS